MECDQMAGLSHLSFEQRRTWEDLDRFWYAAKEGEAAAKRGDSAASCPYDVRAGFNTPRRRWYEGYRHAIEVKATSPEIARTNYWRCRAALARLPHDEFSALIFRLITRGWRSLRGKPPLRAAALIILLGLLPTGAHAACCQPSSYYNWGRVQQQNQAARLRGAQQQQRLCRSLAASGRHVMWSGC